MMKQYRNVGRRMLLIMLLCLPRTFEATVQVDDSIQVIIGDGVDLICKPKHADKIIQIVWMKRRNGTEIKIYTILWNGDIIPENVNGLKERLRFVGNAVEGVGTIHLENARTTDEAVYICRLILFQSKHVSKGIQLQVQARPNISTPSVTPVVGLTDVVLAVCNAAEARPPAEVTWNTGLLHNISSDITENPDGTTTVTSHLLGVPSRDIHHKVVQCLVRHPTFNSVQIFNYSLDIHYPPHSVKIKPTASTANPQEFLCEADGNPEPEHYIWSRDGFLLPTDGVQTKNNTLYFSWLLPELNGMYTCEASNKYGHATGSLHMYILSPRHRYVLVGLLVSVVSLAVGSYFSYSRSGQDLPCEQRQQEFGGNQEERADEEEVGDEPV
ncbi:nectin-1-like [Alosa alosa]|uniref:nectin-1-like n=1 Tax=Alosa alosa TaxID=278164 RepID=UPI00201528AC|nr:nectin-1-like [Alosa alosa]